MFRRRVPARLRAWLGRGEIVRSLGTCAPGVARRRSRLLWVATERMFETMQELPSITPAAVERLMAMLARECAWADEVRFARSGRYFDVEGPAPADFDAIRFEAEAEDCRRALTRNDILPVREQVAHYAGQLGLMVAPGSLDERIIGRAVLRGFAEASEAAAARVRADGAACASAPEPTCLHALPSIVTGPSALAAAIDMVPVPTGAPLPRFAGQTIRQLWPSFCEDQVASRKWKQKIAAQSFGTMRAWVKVNGEGLPNTITSAPAAEFRRVMRQLPGNYAKCSAWQDLSFAAIIARVAGSEYKPVAVTTLNRHLSVLTAFHDWAVRNEQTPVVGNPVEGLWIATDVDLAVAQGGSQDRAMWSEDQLRVLLASPLFLGCQSPFRRHRPGPMLIRDALYWGVLIAMLSGMRREEICQLRVRHVAMDAASGIVYFDLKAPGLELKNRESKRWVPLHDDLIALSFLTDRVEGRAPDDLLFPELRGQDNFGDKLGKKFTRYQKNLKVYQHLLDMHSFRHTVSTLLTRAGVPQAHAEEITGHRSEARRTAFARYDKKATLRILKDGIDTLVLPVDLALLIGAASRPSAKAR